MRVGIFCTLDYHPDLGPGPRAFFRRAIAEAEHAEALGLESFWVAEHHFATYGLGPDPAVLLAAIAERTRRIRLGTAVATLPFYHPLRAAESFALLDQLSDGRLEFGVGSGYLAHEFAGFGIPPEERRGRMDEALIIIRQAWSGEPIAHAGSFFRLEAPPLNVRPLQPGGPRIHMAVTRAPSAPFVARQGLHLLHVPYITLETGADLQALITAYRRAVPPGKEAGVTVACHAFCGTEPWRGLGDPAYRAPEAALDLYLRTRVARGANWSGKPIGPDFVLFGDAEQWRGYQRWLAGIGVDRLLLLTTFGGLGQAEVAASLERLTQVGR